MATDATGTVTSPDSIPTYNTAADAPSGKGLNNIVAAVQSALSSRVGKPSGIVSGEVPVWNGTTWVRSNGTTRITNGTAALPCVTVGAFASGPPGSPVDGDIWTATAVDANGTNWQFRYNAGSASSFKWEFIGGPPVRVRVSTMETTTNTGDVPLATAGPTYSVVRQGDYWIDYSFAGGHSAGGVAIMSLYQDGINTGEQLWSASASVFHHVAKVGIVLSGITTSVASLYRVSGAGTGTWQDRTLRVLPRRVS